MRNLFQLSSIALLAMTSLSSAATITGTYLGNLGAAATTNTLGYDLFDTSPTGTTSGFGAGGGFSGNVFTTGTRLQSLPGFISSVANAGPLNFGASGFGYASANNPAASGTVQLGLALSESGTGGDTSERNLLTITAGSGTPAAFAINVIGNIAGASDHAADYRLVGRGGGNSGLIAQTAPAGGVDVTTFTITGAAPGDVYTLSGIETFPNADGRNNLSVAGVTFNGVTLDGVPEPASLGVLAVGASMALRRRRR